MKRVPAVVLALALTSSAIPAQVIAPPASRQDVPVTSVALFSSGVGYFEHRGTVHGNGTAELRFRTSQMNDVLKSLVLQDEGGGRVTTITYPSQDPLSKSLRSFQVDITGNPTMAQLLNQLRGAHVTIQAQAEHLSGTILGVEVARRQVTDKDPVVDVPVLNLLAGTMLRSVELQKVSGLTFDDPGLEDELTKALAALAQSRDQDKKPVIINFAGTGERRVRVGYVVETPVWKTSYRLIIDDKTARLQGWAIVENQTESDWNNVSLSLVSGRPISFVMDLYSPLYLTRPTVQPARFAELTPQMYEGGIDTNKKDFAPAAAPAPRDALTAQRRIGYDAQGRPSVLNLESMVVGGDAGGAIDAAGSVRSVAATSQLGELFEYTVKNVTLPRQKSAMIPIVADGVDIERVSIYNPVVFASNPLYGVRLKNTTGKSLLQGPLTVLEQGAYAGDAQIDNMPAGQERLISYGVDLQMRVNSTRSSQVSAVTAAKISKGLLTVEHKLVATQSYVADNRSDREKALVIEHPLQPGWTLVDTPKPYEVAGLTNRFKVAVPAGKVVNFVVKEQSVQSQQLALVSTDVTQFLQYTRSGEIAADVRAALAKAAQLSGVVRDLDRQIGDRNRQVTDIQVEQGRIRENMKTVSQTSQYYQRLLSKLNEQETSIERLQRERDDLTTRRDAARRELEDYLRDLTVG